MFLYQFWNWVEPSQSSLTMRILRNKDELDNGCQGDPLGPYGYPMAILGKPLYKKSAVQMEFCQIAFQPPPPPLEQTDALWELFSPKIGKFVKTAVLTLEIDILTMTMVKLCS